MATKRKKRKHNRSAKGGAFERSICKQLSLWWTNGKRDDVFWRTAGSGARATVRRRGSGKATANSDGDILAIDPIGQPLIDAFLFEIKRGYPHVNLSELIDNRGKHDLIKWIKKASRDAKRLGKDWAIIHKRNSKLPLVMFSSNRATWLNCLPRAIINIGTSIKVLRLGDFLESLEFSFNKYPR